MAGVGVYVPLSLTWMKLMKIEIPTRTKKVAWDFPSPQLTPNFLWQGLGG